jgi:uncharacterized membrane protein YGL010W
MFEMYNITEGVNNLTNSQDLWGLFNWVNNNSTYVGLGMPLQIFSAFFLIATFVITMIVTSKYISEDSFMASAFITFMVSVLLAAGQLLNGYVVVMTALMVGFAVVTRK